MRPTNKLVSLIRTALSNKLDLKWLTDVIFDQVDKVIADPNGVVQQRFREQIDAAIDIAVDQNLIGETAAHVHKQVQEFKRQDAQAKDALKSILAVLTGKSGLTDESGRCTICQEYHG